MFFVEIKIGPNERLDDLQLNGLKIIQKIGGYGFTSDSVLLANFVKAKKTDVCLEIGAGCGVISILVNHKQKPAKIYAVEIQTEQGNLAKKNVELCKMNNSIEIVSDKIQNWKKHFSAGQFDVVFSNPPYFKFDKNVCGEITEKVVSRFDKELSLDDFFLSISKLLKFGGKLFFVHDSSRLYECMFIMQKYGITPKRLCFVHPNNQKNATVFLCEACLGGKNGLKVLPPIFTNNLNGDYIQTIQKLFKTVKN